jgi:hypothetical protein
MAEFFYTNINFEEEKPFVYHMNKIPYGLHGDPVTSGAKERVWKTPFPNSVPQGRLKIGRDVILDNLQPSLRDSIMSLGVPRTSVLG